MPQLWCGYGVPRSSNASTPAALREKHAAALLIWAFALNMESTSSVEQCTTLKHVPPLLR
eukprot:1158108-Pelagomonas_calceolata.AAC.12